MWWRCALIQIGLASPLLAQQDSFVRPPVAGIEFGVICDLRPDTQRPEPGTVSGILNLVNQGAPIDVVTTHVPAELGLSFGIRAHLAEDAAPELFNIIVTHPPMGPNGQTVEHWSTTIAPDSPALNLFTFEKDWELIQGPWRFQLARGEDILLQQDFLVTPKGTIPAVQDTCFAPMVLS